jgi:hypothetical protein
MTTIPPGSTVYAVVRPDGTPVRPIKSSTSALRGRWGRPVRFATREAAEAFARSGARFGYEVAEATL